MSFKQLWEGTALVHHYRAIKAAPKETLYNRWLIMTVLLYSMGGIPLSKFGSVLVTSFTDTSKPGTKLLQLLHRPCHRSVANSALGRAPVP